LTEGRASSSAAREESAGINNLSLFWFCRTDRVPLAITFLDFLGMAGAEKVLPVSREPDMLVFSKEADAIPSPSFSLRLETL
jgi:hypothetical protein